MASSTAAHTAQAPAATSEPAPGGVPLEEVTGDAAILNYIFDPNKAFIASAVPLPKTEPEEAGSTTDDDSVRAVEKEAVAAAEAGDLEKALSTLSAGLEKHPDRGSLLNNRAQVFRLLGKNADAELDLDKAIEVESAWIDSHEELKGSAQDKRCRRVLQQAFTQRAILKHKAGDSAGQEADMAAAAAYGSAMARMLTSETNPYAAMCHTAVAKMIESPEDDSAGAIGSLAAGAAASPKP